MKQFLILLGALLTFSACKKNDFAEEDEAAILEYISLNVITDAMVTSEGVHYSILTEGTGAYPTINDNVTVHYIGSLLDGTVFESTYDSGIPVTFPLSAVIEGWQIGVPLINTGGTIKLMIPSRYAYGSTATATIPKNSVLVFDINLIEIL